MVIYENISDTHVKAYSDKGVYIHGGNPEGDYAEAIDPKSEGRTYIETDVPIEDDDTEMKAQAWDIITGGVQE